ncbi:MFS transporter [Arthrobacter sp. AQ5-06]|nr:MFS transporter [Arthrobacter sp. AQ5-06]
MISGLKQLRTFSRAELAVVLVGLAVVVPEGYDLIVYGSTLPAMLAYEPWSLTLGQAGLLGSLALIGMAASQTISGIATDRIGRRRVILFGTFLYSAASLLCAAAPNPAVLGIGRFLVGLGAGAVMTVVVALVFEYSPQAHRNVNLAIVLAGTGLGGAAATLVSIFAVPTFGFQFAYGVGALAGLVAIIFAARYLPESVVFLQAAGKPEQAAQWAKRLNFVPVDTGAAAVDAPSAPGTSRARLLTLFSSRYRATTILLGLAFLIMSLLAFGLLTWLPQLMRTAGYPLGSALTFLLILNLGVAIGPVLMGRLGDVLGSKRTIVIAFLLSLAGIVGLSFSFAPMFAVYAAALIAGTGIVGAKSLLSVLVASSYPTEIRATAVGTALTMGSVGGFLGPVFGSAILAAGLPGSWNFYAFALPALLGILCVVLVSRGASRPRLAPHVDRQADASPSSRQEEETAERPV